MEKYVWLVEHSLLEEWNFVQVEYGVVYVLSTGISMMLKLFAGGLDYPVIVSNLI